MDDWDGENRKMLAEPIVSECTDPRIDMIGLSLTDSRNQLYCQSYHTL
jgi:hypothetical protein